MTNQVSYDLSPDSALQLIQRFRKAGNIIFGAHIFSVGRERWIKGAEQVFQDAEVTGDSIVRFIRGDYGVGKTNFAARLFHNALQRGWVAAYVELSDNVMLHEFHQVFSQIVDKLYLPEQIAGDGAEAVPPLGFASILDFYYRKVRHALGLGPGSDIPATALRDVTARINSVLIGSRIHGDFAAALRGYFQTRIEEDPETNQLIRRWFRAEPDVRLPHLGVMKPISKINGKDHLRSLSAFIVGIGYKGTLLIIDELERIMEESRLRRRKSYTILRELIDNVDGQNGMKTTCLYAAAPPGQFESQNGFIEVEALASRIQAPIMTIGGLVDYTATVVDLDTSPLTDDDHVELAKRLRAIHAIARKWDATTAIPDSVITTFVDQVKTSRPNSRTRVREFCVEFISLLERTYGAAA